MSKALIIAGALAAALLVFLGSLTVVVNTRGGLPAESPVSAAPVLGRLFRTQPVSDPEDELDPEDEAVDLPAGRQAPFLSFGPEARLHQLAQELTVKKTEYDARLRTLERRERELQAWEQQVKRERDELRDNFRRQREELAGLREELVRRQAELEQLQIQFRSAEEANLRKTAEIYGRMDPERAADILGEMYADGKQETVVKIIYLMQDRSAAQTLAAFADARISAQITEQLRRVKEAQQQEGGR